MLLQNQAVLTVSLVKVAEGIRPVAMTPAPQGNQVALSLEDGSVRIIDISTRVTVRNLAKHPGPAYALAWSGDGAWIATGDETGRVWVEDARTGSKVVEYRTHTRGVQKVSFNLGRTLLASVGKDDTIHVQKFSEGTPKEERAILGKGANLYGGEFNPGTSHLITTGILGDVGRVYDAITGAVKGLLSEPANQGTFDVAFNRNGTRFVTTGRDGISLVWDSKTNKRLARLMGHQDWVTNAAWSPSGRFIATSSTDRRVIVWNSANYAKVAILENMNSVGSPICFSGNGSYLVGTDVGGNLAIYAVKPAQPAVAVKKPTLKRPTPRRTTRTRGGGR
jgi:WD40 repeat protein